MTGGEAIIILWKSFLTFVIGIYQMFDITFFADDTTDTVLTVNLFDILMALLILYMLTNFFWKGAKG